MWLPMPLVFNKNKKNVFWTILADSPAPFLWREATAISCLTELFFIKFKKFKLEKFKFKNLLVRKPLNYKNFKYKNLYFLSLLDLQRFFPWSFSQRFLLSKKRKILRTTLLRLAEVRFDWYSWNENGLWSKLG